MTQPPDPTEPPRPDNDPPLPPEQPTQPDFPPSERPTQPPAEPAQPRLPPPAEQVAPGFPPPPSDQPLQPAPPPPEGYGYGQAVPGSAPPGMFLDPVSGLTLPQGVQLASVGRRIGAYFLAIVLSIATLIIGYVIWGLIVWGRGQTPALQVLGMRCWRPESGKTATWGTMALREIVGRFLLESIIGLIGIISLILMVTGKERKTIHDYVAGTVVLHDPSKVLPR